MKNLMIVLLALGSFSTFASATLEKVQIEIKADSKELCQMTSDSVFKDVEGDLRETGAYVKSLSACNKGLDGKFRKSVKFIKPTF